MAISQKLPPLYLRSSSSSSISSSSDGGSSSSIHTTDDRDAGDSNEALVMAAALQRSSKICMSRAPPMRSSTPACLRVPPTRCQARCMRSRRASSTSLKVSLGRLHQQLAALRSILPPVTRSASASNVIMDALKYKKALAKQIQILQSALPFSHQVNVERLGSAALQIRVSCSKEPGLLVALMEVLESFGLSFANMSVSCLNDKIRIDGVSTKGSICERRGSLKVALMATIMHFQSKGSREAKQ